MGMTLIIPGIQYTNKFTIALSTGMIMKFQLEDPQLIFLSEWFHKSTPTICIRGRTMS